MTNEDIDKIFEKLREHLQSKAVPSKMTGSFTTHLQTGGVAGKIDVKIKV